MPITITEKATSGAATISSDLNSTAEKLYSVTGLIYGEDVAALVEATLLKSYFGLSLNNYKITPVGAGNWDVVATYAGKRGCQSFAFETGKGKEKKYVSEDTVLLMDKDSISHTPTDLFHNAIAVGKDGKPQGVEIVVPQFDFNVTRIMPNPLHGNFITLLHQATGKVNNATVNISIRGTEFSFAEGELLFLGAQGQQRGGADWEITLNFAAERNRTGITIGDVVGISKKGWDYLWVWPEDQVDDTHHVTTQAPAFVLVEEVCQRYPLNELFDIPTNTTGAPTGLIAGLDGQGGILLSWSSTTNTVTFNVYRGTTSGTYQGLASGLPYVGGGGTFTDNSATVTINDYYYVVTAVSAVGMESGPSNEASVVS